MIRRSLRSWIEADSALEVCGEAENGKDAIEKADQLHPEIIILDFQMPVMNGLEAARQITRRTPSTAIIMFTLHPSQALLQAALQAGARDVVSKTDRLTEHLSSAIHQVLN
jgi:DNA-binding NarL/FixJ family response regulator